MSRPQIQTNRKWATTGMITASGRDLLPKILSHDAMVDSVQERTFQRAELEAARLTVLEPTPLPGQPVQHGHSCPAWDITSFKQWPLYVGVFFFLFSNEVFLLQLSFFFHHWMLGVIWICWRWGPELSLAIRVREIRTALINRGREIYIGFLSVERH